MITTIVNENTGIEFNDNAYPGMTLAEACNQLQIDTINAINEFQMNLLLTEHAYLYENGCEISYVNEDGELNEKGHNLKESIKALGYKIWSVVSDAFDKAITWIIVQVEKVREFFAKKGISKNLAKRAVDIYCSGDPYVEQKKIVIDDVDYDGFKHSVETFKNNKYDVLIANYNKLSEENKSFYNVYVTENKEEKLIDKDMAGGAYKAVYETKSTILSDIIKQKAEFRKKIRSLIDEANKGQVEANIDDLKKALSVCSIATKDSIRVYHTYMSGQISIIRTVVSATKSQLAANSKAIRKNSAEELLNKVKKSKKNNEEAAAPAAEEVKESAVYNGKYFNV